MENVLSCDLPINGQFKYVEKRVMVLRSTPVLPLLREILHKCIFKTKCIYFKIRFLKHLILKADGSLKFASSETGYSKFVHFTLMMMMMPRSKQQQVREGTSKSRATSG